jgi:hypothetical protein
MSDVVEVHCVGEHTVVERRIAGVQPPGNPTRNALPPLPSPLSASRSVRTMAAAVEADPATDTPIQSTMASAAWETADSGIDAASVRTRKSANNSCMFFICHLPIPTPIERRSAATYSA